MFQPPRRSPPTSAMARMTLITLIIINDESGGLSPKAPYVCDQLIDLRLGEFLFESRHFVAAIADRIEKTLVGHFILPLAAREVARMRKLAFESLTATILAVTRSALRLKSRLGIAGNYSCAVDPGLR